MVPSHSNPPSLDEITMIPREFFVLETNAIPPLTQYPTTEYQSRFTSHGQWETIVFPALTPHTRLQVIHLRQALETMRLGMSDNAIEDDDHIKMVQYTKKEFRLYSLCFHELTRQIKFICKEQSELLVEIQSHYNAALTRLISLVEQLQQQIDHHQIQFDELQAVHLKTMIENDRLVQQEKQAREAFERDSQSPRRSRVLLNYRQNRRDVVDSDTYDSMIAKEDDDDKREAEWRRQRRARPQMGEVIRSSKRSSLAEENLAAAVLQTAYQKYTLRKEQHRLALRMGKNVAAIDIQRRYRGFRERQLVLHRRAVIQTILKRREQNAAIELLQANVRMFLANKRQADKKFALEDMLPESPALVPAASTRLETSSLETASHKFQGRTQGFNDIWNDELGSFKSPVDSLITILQQLIDLGATFADKSVLKTVDRPTIAEAEDHSAETYKREPTQTMTKSNEQLRNVLAQAEQLVKMFRSPKCINGSIQVNQTACTEKTESENQNKTDPDTLLGDNVKISRATSTSLLGDFGDNFPEFAESKHFDEISPLGNQIESNIVTPTDEHPTSSASNSPQTIVPVFTSTDESASVMTTSGTSNLNHNSDLHLDGTLWEATVQSQTPVESTHLMQLLSSRDQNSKLVWLKQFIADIYDTIVGKMRDQHPQWFSVNHHCALAMSCNEWQEHRRSAMQNQSLESFNIASLTRDHFQCQLGLRHLVDAAVENFENCIDTFIEVDSDVRRFNDFLHHDRSQDELRFFCVCRYLASGLYLPAASEQSHLRQPVFHPVTMREIIDHTHALQIAEKLFRTDQEKDILNADKLLIEADNPVYTRYLPSQGFHQFGSILSSYFSPVEITTHLPVTTSLNQSRSTMSNSPRSPKIETTKAGALTRPSNINHFHAKQFNVNAARSPLVRRLHQKSGYALPTERVQFNPSIWIHFDELIDLFLKYRADMNHFHLFLKWARELFAQTASLPAETPADIDPRLLDESLFVDTLLSFSLGPTQRELQNIFHNALRQRGLQAYMSSRVFVSVVLLLLRNGMISATSYRPLQKIVRDSPRSSLHCERLEQEWISLGLKWRVHEREFEAIVERLYEAQPHASTERKTAAAARAVRLLQLRNELYELFIYQTGSTHLSRARDVLELLVLGLEQASRGSTDQDTSSDDIFITPFDTEREEDDAASRWETAEPESAICI